MCVWLTLVSLAACIDNQFRPSPRLSPDDTATPDTAAAPIDLVKACNGEYGYTVIASYYESTYGYQPGRPLTNVTRWVPAPWIFDVACVSTGMWAVTWDGIWFGTGTAQEDWRYVVAYPDEGPIVAATTLRDGRVLMGAYSTLFVWEEDAERLVPLLTVNEYESAGDVAELEDGTLVWSVIDGTDQPFLLGVDLETMETWVIGDLGGVTILGLARTSSGMLGIDWDGWFYDIDVDTGAATPIEDPSYWENFTGLTSTWPPP